MPYEIDPPENAHLSSPLDPGAHYLRDVLRLGDTKTIVVSNAIYSSNKVKLVHEGAQITSQLFDRLIQHKLEAPIEQCLSLEGGVDIPELEERVRFRMKGNPIFEQMHRWLDQEVILSSFRDLQLPKPLAFKLTLARDTRPKLFDHSIDVATMAAYLRAYSSRKTSDLSTAAAAGLYHDLGILHIPAEVMTAGKTLDESARHYLYTHPITTAFIVQQYQQLPAEIGVAISEHHERMDGSGYPNGLIGDQISELGKLLMLADSSAALLNGHIRLRGSVSLRLLRRKFDTNLLEWAHKLFASVDVADVPSTTPDLTQLTKKLLAVSEILAAWESAFCAVSDQHEGSTVGPLISLIDRRVVSLQRTLLESGFVFSELAEFSHLAELDARSSIETFELASEALWQLKDIALEARRHWEEYAHAESHLVEALEWIVLAEKTVCAL